MSNQTAEESKIFEGCKHPELVGLYIQGVKDGAVEQCLTVLKEKVENQLFFADFGDEKIEAGYDKGIKKHKEYVLTLIEEELQ